MGQDHGTPTAAPDIAGWLACGLSETGYARSRNEDALALDPSIAAYILADGMGGHPGGDVASRLAVEAAHRALRAAGPPPDAATGRAVLAAAFRAASAAVEAEGRRVPSLALMGTTLTLLSLAAAPAEGMALFAHMGDSRLYRLGGDGLRQVTEDHTVAMDLVRAGAFDPESAARSPYWHTLSRVIVATPDDPAPDPDLGTVDLAGADALLVCSDGLTNMVPDAEIAALLRARAGAPCAAAGALVAAALAAGGADNVTVVVAMPGRG
jgi:protein phosphatase